MISGFLFLVVIVLINKRLAVHDFVALAIFIVLNLAMPGYTLAELVLWCCLWVLATVATALLMQFTAPKFFNYVLWSWNKKVKE